jgi:hypothetical protein
MNQVRHKRNRRLPKDLPVLNEIIRNQPLKQVGLGALLKSMVGKRFNLSSKRGLFLPTTKSNANYWFRQAGIPFPSNKEVEHVWMAKRGSFAKRLALWAEKVHGKQIKPEILRNIGATIESNCSKEFNFYATIYEGPFNWHNQLLARCSDTTTLYKQLFGTLANSCWWSKNYKNNGHFVSEWWYAYGGYALLLYSNPDMLCSDMGKAWVYIMDDDVVLLGNAFGNKTEESTNTYGDYIDLSSTLAQLLIDFFGLKDYTYSKDATVNYGANSYGDYHITIYNNRALIGPKDKIASMYNVNIGRKGTPKVREFFDLDKYKINRLELIKKYSNNRVAE